MGAMPFPAPTGHKIELREISQRFSTSDSDRPTLALDTTNLTVEPGQFIGLVGPSGCGKTTVLNIVGGLMQPSRGNVSVGGRPAREGDPEIGYLLARDSLLPWRTALANVMLPLELRNTPKVEAEERASSMLSMVGLGKFLDSFPSQLSHGMRQRVALARTLVTRPGTILMDEPFSALDAETRLKLQGEFLKVWEAQKSTVLFVTHDLAEAIVLCDKVLVFSARPGRVVADFTIDLPRPRQVLELQGNPKYHKYFQDIWAIFRKELS